MVKKKEVNISIKSEETDVGKWLGRIGIAQKKHEDQFIKNAKSWRDFYKGNHFPDFADKSNLVVINYTYSILKAILPQIYFQDPHLYITASGVEFADNTRIVEDALNDTWRTLKIKRQMKRIILDMLIMGFGIGKIGYNFVTDKQKEKSLETQLEFTEFVKEENPYFLRQSPFDVVFDFEAKCFDDIRWLAACYYVPVDDIKDRYGVDTKDVKGNYTAGEKYPESITISSYDKQIMEDDLKRVKIWEIQDIVDGKVMTICDEKRDKFLLNMDNPYNLQSNYRLLYVNEIPDEMYPLSEVANLRDINLWMDRVNSLLMQDIMKSQRKVLYEEDCFASPEEMEKFLSGEDLQKCMLNSGAIKDSKILITSASAIPADFYNNNELCKDHLNNVSGVGTSQRGVEDSVERRTAFEAGIIDRNSQLRNSERLDVITDYCVNVACDLLKVMQQFGSKETEFYSKQADAYGKWKKEDIKGNYDVRVEIGSTTRRDSDAERQFILQFAGQMMEAVDASGVPIFDKREFTKLVFEKFGIPVEDINRAMLTPDEFMQAQQLAMQLQAMLQPQQPPMPEQPPMPMPMPEQMPPEQMAINPEEILAQLLAPQAPQEAQQEYTPEELALLQGV